jgi:hypothetical protein
MAMLSIDGFRVAGGRTLVWILLTPAEALEVADCLADAVELLAKRWAETTEKSEKRR